METPKNPGLLQYCAKRIEKLPLPLRIVLAIWLCASLAFHLGEPPLAESLPPLARYIVLLPMAIGSFGIAIFLLWAGFRTGFRTWRSIARGAPARDPDPQPIHGFIGGIGALNIYLFAYALLVFGAMKVPGERPLGIGLSALLCSGLAFALFRRGPHPGDVKVFLWGALGVTVFMALLFLFVTPPQ